MKPVPTYILKIVKERPYSCNTRIKMAIAKSLSGSEARKMPGSGFARQSSDTYRFLNFIMHAPRQTLHMLDELADKQYRKRKTLAAQECRTNSQ